MAAPVNFASHFDMVAAQVGDGGNWDSEADTGSKLDFPHYSELVRSTGSPVPFRGAYCMRIQPGDTNDHQK